jgi:hypothetical protein
MLLAIMRAKSEEAEERPDSDRRATFPGAWLSYRRRFFVPLPMPTLQVRDGHFDTS